MAKQGTETKQQTINDKLKKLEQKITRLQNFVNQVRTNPNYNADAPFDETQWNRDQRHGEADDDPALFQ